MNNRRSTSRALRACCSVGIVAATAVVSCRAEVLTRSSAARIIGDHEQFKAPVQVRVDFDEATWRRGKLRGLWAEQYGFGPPRPELTAAGKELFASIGLGILGPMHIQTKPIARRLVEVTGIADAPVGQNAKQVEFSWVLSEPPPWLSSEPAHDMPHSSTAILRLFDDGWRVERINVDELDGDTSRRYTLALEKIPGLTISRSASIDALLAEANANAFVSPPDGVMQAERLVKYLGVRCRIHAAFQQREAEIGDPTKVQSVVSELRRRQARELADAGMSEREYQFMVERVYKTQWAAMSGVSRVDIPPANLELFKRHEAELKRCATGGLDLIGF